MKTLIKMLLIKSQKTIIPGECKWVYNWLMKLPMRKRPLALWMLLHMRSWDMIEGHWKFLNE